MGKVVTSIVGNLDNIRDKQNTEGAEFLAFTDQHSDTWETRKPYSKFKDNVMNAKIHKVLIHKFVDADISMWLDGNMTLNKPLDKILDRWMGENDKNDKNDIVVFSHPTRDCAYEEIEACLQLGRGNPEELKKQRDKYLKEGYPRHNGLPQCNMVLRRHNSPVERFNEKWWAEVCSQSHRDQVSFPYVASKCDVKVKYLEGVGYIEKHPYFSYFNHDDTQ